MATNVEYHKFETLEDAYPIAMALDHAMYQPIQSVNRFRDNR